MRSDKKPYSYRDDLEVPEFDDTHAVLVFDGVCALCSGGMARIMQWDRGRRLRFATAQSELGRALLAHYGCDTVNFNTMLVVSEGRGYMKSTGYLETARILGGAWHLLRVFGIIPRPLCDWLYDVKARNRYRIFGTTEYCAMVPDDDRVIAR